MKVVLFIISILLGFSGSGHAEEVCNKFRKVVKFYDFRLASILVAPENVEVFTVERGITHATSVTESFVIKSFDYNNDGEDEVVVEFVRPAGMGLYSKYLYIFNPEGVDEGGVKAYVKQSGFTQEGRLNLLSVFDYPIDLGEIGVKPPEEKRSVITMEMVAIENKNYVLIRDERESFQKFSLVEYKMTDALAVELVCEIKKKGF